MRRGSSCTSTCRSRSTSPTCTSSTRRVVRRCASFAALLGVALAALAGSSSGGGMAAPAPPSGALLESLSQPPARAAIASQRIYFVMTDRYRNGDPSNDTGGLGGGPSTNGFDPADIGFFHGGDFKG